MERAIRYIRDSFFAGRRWTDIDDLNAQAEDWCTGVASERPWPDDRSISVAEAFAAEQGHLICLPANPFPCDEQVDVRIGKTPYARFDGNDYSLPHTHVRRTLALHASLTEVRVLAAGEVIARHRRSFDKGQQIEDPAHIAGLVEAKRAASAHRGIDRLAQAAPASQELLRRAAERGTPLLRSTASLTELLDAYGAAELGIAIEEALARDVPHPNAVRQALEQRREQREQSPPLPLTLPEHDKLRGIALRPASLAGYDQLHTDPAESTHDTDD